MKKKVKVYHIKKKSKFYGKYRQIYFILILLLVFILGVIFGKKAGIRIPGFPNFGKENIALRRVVHSSSWLNLTNSATQAVDGNQNTTWESNHVFPAYVTVNLDKQYVINEVVLKLPAAWGAKTEKVEILGSLDNVSFTQISAPTNYSISPIATIAIKPVMARYIRVVVSSNSQTNSAQLGEIEVYGVEPRTPWTIQSIDVMKYSKDVVCNPPSASTIDKMTEQIATTSANFVAISTPYDNPACGSAIALTNAWVTSARARGLHVWHRHMSLAFEGIYNTTKAKNLTAYTQQIVDYIKSNADQFQNGDIFTPTPEPASAGIAGVTYCPTICQFDSADEYNKWIQTTQFVVNATFAEMHKDVKVGYYGHSGFIVWGENNPDWKGKGFLTQATIDSMDGVIAMDSYPESYGGSMVSSLNGAHERWPNARLVVGEWGTITAGNDAQKQQRVIDALSAAERPYVIGFNYWHLGPAGNEGLLDASLRPLPAFQTIKDFYTGLR